MAQKKVDGIIEAVRYAPGGRIDLVRAYERRGIIWSDLMLLERKDLAERIKKGKCFVTGERREYLGGIFETGLTVLESRGNLITEGQTGRTDFLAGVPVF